jgi:hypothetical protein
MRNAERFLSPIEDKRHNQILFVIEVPDQPLEQHSARVRVIVAAMAQPVGIPLQRLQQRIRSFCRASHVAMDVVMIALQHVESARQTRIGGLEDREIMQVLDLMMNVELIQHELQSWHELTRELGGWKLPCPEVHRDAFNRRRQLPEHRVARQPEARHSAQVRMGVPLLARITGEHHAQILRPAASAGQRKSFNFGGMRPFDRHGRLHSQCAHECEGQTCGT